jgi:hypothetical protein
MISTIGYGYMMIELSFNSSMFCTDNNIVFPFTLCSFFCAHCIVCPCSIYGLWLSLCGIFKLLLNLTLKWKQKTKKNQKMYKVLLYSRNTELYIYYHRFFANGQTIQWAQKNEQRVRKGMNNDTENNAHETSDRLAWHPEVFTFSAPLVTPVVLWFINMILIYSKSYWGSSYTGYNKIQWIVNKIQHCIHTVRVSVLCKSQL